MNRTPRVPPEELVESMKDEIEQYVKKVMEAVNEAPDGEWIAGSEERVRNLSAEMRRRVFERAVQKRVDAAEAAFPPSEPSDDGKTAVG
jgi:GTP cyclohydrolase I